MKHTLTLITALPLAPLAALQAQDARMEQTKALCREYTAGFISQLRPVP